MLSTFNAQDDEQSRILIVSQRGLRQQAANCCLYEFENAISDFDRADLFSPNSEVPLARKIYRLAKYLTKSDRLASDIAPFPAEISLKRDYELLFAVFDNPWQMYMINCIQGWRDRTKFTACYIGEMWEKELDNWRLLQEPFASFDHVFLGVQHCVDKVSKIIGRPCSYLPPAVDTVSFCPYPFLPERSIDVCYVGRRSTEVHRELLDLTTQKDFFYYYDTAKSLKLEVDEPREHRRLLAHLLKRSRYTIANYAKFNQPQETGGKQEIGYRFFEGAAAGTVMLGMPPKTETFKQYFDWSNPVIEIDINNCNIKEVISELDAQPELLAQISRDNVVNSLQKHDWVYRWRQVLNTFNIEPTAATLSREQYLNELVNSINPKVVDSV
jgi:hypothetical protein